MPYKLIFCSKKKWYLDLFLVKKMRNVCFLKSMDYGHTSRVSNIESDNSQNVRLEDYNNISDGIFPHFTTPSTLQMF